MGGISIRQQSIKGDYRKLTANEKGDHRNIAWGGGWGYSGGNQHSPTENGNHRNIAKPYGEIR